MTKNETFGQLFEDVADAVGILTKNLVVTHKGTRVFSASTPLNLGIWSEAEFGEQEFHFKSIFH